MNTLDEVYATEVYIAVRKQLSCDDRITYIDEYPDFFQELASTSCVLFLADFIVVKEFRSAKLITFLSFSQEDDGRNLSKKEVLSLLGQGEFNLGMFDLSYAEPATLVNKEVLYLATISLHTEPGGGGFIDELVQRLLQEKMPTTNTLN